MTGILRYFGIFDGYFRQGGTLVLRPMRETLEEVGSAEVGLVTPQGEVRNLD